MSIFGTHSTLPYWRIDNPKCGSANDHDLTINAFDITKTYIFCAVHQKTEEQSFTHISIGKHQLCTEGYTEFIEWQFEQFLKQITKGESWRDYCACGKKISKDEVCCKECEKLQI